MNKCFSVLVGLCSVLTTLLSSGQKTGSCGEVLPGLHERNSQKEDFLKWRAQLVGNTSQEEVTIPVVFHIMDNDAATSVSHLESLLAKVNQGFANEGIYATDYGKDAGIRFCLAKTTPDGGASDGINLLTSRYEDFDMDLETWEFIQHVYWDQSQYLNVWVANSIRSENQEATFYTGRGWWSRFEVGAFATAHGVVLQGLDAGTLIHEIGHYFGLLHTFDGFRTNPCKNDDCLVDGDMICDTPPDKSIVNSCEDNSCNTDVLSNFSNQTFFLDTLDMGSNFMDYGGCPTEFSHDQIDRMHFIIDTYYPDLPAENNPISRCERPCHIEAIAIQTDRNLIATNQQVTFNSTGATYDHYEWYIYGNTDQWTSAPSTTQPVALTNSLNYTFDTKGWYAVYVKAWNSEDINCFTSFTRNLMVTCGVDARFSPDKRRMASKQPDSLFMDSVTYTNYSAGADSYEWTVKFTARNGSSSLPDFTSNAQHLTYQLLEPGEYEIQLSASDGFCTDLSNVFYQSVLDPTMDGAPEVNSVSCVNDDSIKVIMTLYNYGFDTIKAGTPISFYNGDPRKSIGSVWLDSKVLPSTIMGFDELLGYEKKAFDFDIKAKYEELDSLFVVFNDTGTVTFPIQFPPNDKDVLSTNTQFPPSGQAELTYNNNVFAYGIKQPKPHENITACLDEELVFADSLCKKSITWTSESHGLLGEGSLVTYVVTGDDQIIKISEYSDGSIGRDTFEIKVSAPLLDLSRRTYTINKGESVQLQTTSNPSDSIRWSPASTLNDPFAGSPIASPLVTTTYHVSVTDVVGCAATDQVTVIVVSKGFIPDLFTPNGDGRNDQLLIYGMDGVRSFMFKIFNRAGNILYNTNSAEEMKTTGWDGRWKGVKQPPGVFYWSISGVYEDGTPLLLNNEKTGIIHLIR